jgi:hypothetical protein
MPDSLPLGGGPWWRFAQYEVRDGYIRPVGGAPPRRFDPWAEYLKTRMSRTKDGARPDPPYRSLIALLEKVTPEVTEAQTGRPLGVLSPESATNIARWCKRYGLLGVLTQRLHLVALAPRWRRAGHGDEILPSQTVHLRANDALQPFRTEETAGPAVVAGGRRCAGDFVSDRDRPPDCLPTGVFLNPPTAEWTQEPLGATWARFFPDVPASECETYPYPTPLTKEFWSQYAEPVGDFLHAASIVRDVVHGLTEFDETLSPREREAKLDQALRTLHELLAPVSPTLSSSPYRAFQQQWVSPSLLGAFAMMLMHDMDGNHQIRRCLACNTPIVSKAYQRRYCSKRCRDRLRMRRFRKRQRERAAAAKSKAGAPAKGPRQTKRGSPTSRPHRGRRSET